MLPTSHVQVSNLSLTTLFDEYDIFGHGGSSNNHNEDKTALEIPKQPVGFVLSSGHIGSAGGGNEKFKGGGASARGSGVVSNLLAPRDISKRFVHATVITTSSELQEHGQEK